MSIPLQQRWWRRDQRPWHLWPVSLAYRAVVAGRRAMYRWGLLDSHEMPVPVIVVGNVVVGGAGKTPVVAAVVRHLRGRGLKVGVVSRGYGRDADKTGKRRRAQKKALSVSHDSTASEVGDEPLMLARHTGAPVFVASRRVDAARALLQSHPDTDVIVADDGLQHLALARDIEVCVFDDRGAGNGWLLPAGPLREPWPRPCDLVLHTGCTPAFDGGFGASRALADHAVRADGTRIALANLVGKPVVAIAGIAKPAEFFDMLSARGLWLDTVQALPDHDDFSQWQPPADRSKALLCTEKDAAKLWKKAPEAWAVPLLFAPHAGFFNALDRLLEPKLSSIHGQETA